MFSTVIRKIILNFALIVFPVVSFAQWQSVPGGPFGGDVKAIISANGSFYAATNSSVYKYVSDLWIDLSAGTTTNSSGNSFVAFGDTVLLSSAIGAYRIINSSSTWTPINNGLPQNTNLKRPGYIAMLTKVGNTAYAATQNGVFKSSDRGDNWTAINDSLPVASQYLAMISSNENGLYASGNSYKIFRYLFSKNYWEEMKSGLPDYPSFRNIISIQNNLYMALLNYPYVLKSDNNGDSWTSVATSLNGSYFGARSLFADETALYLSTDDGLYKTEIGTDSWTKIETAPNQFKFNQTIKEDGVFYAACDGPGIIKSADQWATFSFQNSGMRSLRINAVKSSSGKLFVGSEAAGLFVSDDKGESFQSLLSLVPEIKINALESRNNTVYAGTKNGFYTSTDNGATWTKSLSGLNDREVKGIAANDSVVFAGTSSGFYRSSNNGTNFVKYTNGLGGADIRSITVTDSVVVVGTWGGSGAYRSEDNGFNWKDSGTGLPYLANYGTALANHHGIIFYGTGGAVSKPISKSVDQAKTWINGSNGFPANWVINTFLSAGNAIFVGYAGGVYFSTNDGDLWKSGADGMPESKRTFTLENSSGFLYAALENNGLWRNHFSNFADVVVGVNESASSKISEFRLLPNYPNPFNPSTTIRFELPSQQSISVQIYDVMGRLISVPVQQKTFSSGMNSVEINASQFSSGVYFVQVGNSHFRQVQKIILSK